jgi:hypothetical protein
MKDNGNVENSIGEFPLNGAYVKTSSHEFTMEILNTRAALAERIFYPWLKEVTLPFWVYDEQPYTTADIEVDFGKHSDMKYVFVGCRPKQIETLKPSNDLSSPIRSVTMTFDYMFVMSDLERCESAGDKLLGAAKGLLGGASNMLGL